MTDWIAPAFAFVWSLLLHGWLWVIIGVTAYGALFVAEEAGALATGAHGRLAESLRLVSWLLVGLVVVLVRLA